MSSFTAALRGNVRIDESFSSFVRVLLLTKAILMPYMQPQVHKELGVDSFRHLVSTAGAAIKFESTWLLAVSYAPHAVLCSRLAQAASNQWCKVLHI